MINKKNVLGKAPFNLGDKDAVHVAIVSVRAASCIERGAGVAMNEYGEAYQYQLNDNKRVGIADPFRKHPRIERGEMFWLLMSQETVPNVQHVWEHPTESFAPPKREIEYDEWIMRAATEAGVTYEELMNAARKIVDTNVATECDNIAVEDVDWYDFWDSWSDETGHEFENYGSACCPETEFPDAPFIYVEKVKVDDGCGGC